MRPANYHRNRKGCVQKTPREYVSPRFLARSIAHAKVRAAGVAHPNKPRKGIRGNTLPSIFAVTWRKVLFEPEPKMKFVRKSDRRGRS